MHAQVATAQLEAQRHVAEAEVRVVAAEGRVQEAQTALALSEARREAVDTQLRVVADGASERLGVARLGEESRAEAAEAQLRAMKEEVAGLRRAHDLEITSLRGTPARASHTSSAQPPRGGAHRSQCGPCAIVRH